MSLADRSQRAATREAQALALTQHRARVRQGRCRRQRTRTKAFRHCDLSLATGSYLTVRCRSPPSPTSDNRSVPPRPSAMQKVYRMIQPKRIYEFTAGRTALGKKLLKVA